jgi:hypothetical protein
MFLKNSSREDSSGVFAGSSEAGSAAGAELGAVGLEDMAVVLFAGSLEVGSIAGAALGGVVLEDIAVVVFAGSGSAAGAALGAVGLENLAVVVPASFSGPRVRMKTLGFDRGIWMFLDREELQSEGDFQNEKLQSEDRRFAKFNIPSSQSHRSINASSFDSILCP